MNTLKAQLIKAIEKSGGIFAEYRISNDDDYLLVTFNYDEKINGLFISGDFCLDCRFSCDVTIYETGFTIPFDADYFDDIDYYLQCASDEIVEGYLSVNDLFQYEV